MLFWGLPELPHSLNTLLCCRLQGVKSPGRLGTRADAFSLQLLVLHCIQNKSDSQLVCVGIITQVQLGKPTKGETRPAEDFKTSRLGIWRHSLTIMLWHAVTLHKLAEGVTFRRCVLFSPTWTHVEEHSWDATIWYHLRETSVEMGEEQQFTSVYGLKHVVSKHAGKLHLPIPNALLCDNLTTTFLFLPSLLEVSLSTTVISTFQIFSTSL